jgi:hypothetical protein
MAGMRIGGVMPSPVTSATPAAWVARFQQRRALRAEATAGQAGSPSEIPDVFPTPAPDPVAASRPAAASLGGFSAIVRASDLSSLGTALLAGNLPEAQQVYSTLIRNLQSTQQAHDVQLSTLQATGDEPASAVSPPASIPTGSTINLLA